MDKENGYPTEITGQVLTEEEAKKTVAIQREFLKDYAATKGKVPVEEWLSQELKKQLPERSEEEISEMSKEIVSSLAITEESKESLQKAVKAGRSRESWLASTLMQHTSHMTGQEAAKYLQGLDDAVKKANESMRDTVLTNAGIPNQNRNLDGFIAEQHHANTYNLKAQATGGDCYAEVLKPGPGERYGKNSVDIVIRDSASGKIVSRYQAKYGATAEETIKKIREGDYRGQQLLVPEEQLEAVRKAFPNRKVSSVIGEGKITSTPLTKEQGKALQKQAQGGAFQKADWNDYAAKDIALGIGKQAGIAGLQGAVIGAGMDILSKVCSGEPVDGEEVIETAVVSGADTGVKAAAAGALKTASEKGVLSVLPKGTPGTTFANIAFVAVENLKVAGKVASGELTAREGLDKMGETTVSCVAGISASAKGSAVGAAVGSVLGLPGQVVGGLVGGAVGYVAGSKVGQVIAKGVQAVGKAACTVVKGLWEGAKSVVSGVGNFIGGVLDFLFG